MKEKGYSLRSIAKTLGRSVSSISDELKRNAVEGTYDAQKANHKAYVRRKGSKYQGMRNYWMINPRKRSRGESHNRKHLKYQFPKTASTDTLKACMGEGLKYTGRRKR